MSAENQIISAIKNGDTLYIEKVYNQYRGPFLSWAIKNYHCQEEEAREIYQYAFIVFYQKILSQDITHITSSVKSFLYAVGKNKLLEQLRYKQKFAGDIEDHDFQVNDDKEHILEQERKFTLVEQGLNEIGEPCKTLLVKSYFEKKSSQVISEEMGYKNSDTAKNLKHKCFKRLRKVVQSLSEGMI